MTSFLTIMSNYDNIHISILLQNNQKLSHNLWWLRFDPRTAYILHTLFFISNPFVSNEGSTQIFLGNWALKFPGHKQFHCMIFLANWFFWRFLCINIYKNKQQLSNFEPSNHPKFLINWALTPESSWL